MMKNEKSFTQSEIYSVIDEMIHKEMELKNAFIEKNGYKHTETLNRFAERVTAFSELYGKFK